MNKNIGFVIQRYDWAEHGSILIIFSKDQGKLKLADRSLKRKEVVGGQADLYSLVEFQYAQYPDQDIGYVFGIESIEKYSKLYQSSWMPMYVSLVFEALEGCIPVQEPVPEIYHLIENFMAHLHEDELSVAAHVVVVIAALLQNLGQVPRVDHCVSCQTSLLSSGVSSYLVEELGGLLCDSCCRVPDQGYEIGATAVLVIHELLQRKPLSTNQLSKNLMKQVLDVMCLLVEDVMGRDYKSYQYLNKFTSEPSL